MKTERRMFVVTEEGALHETYRDVNGMFPELAKEFVEELKLGRRPIICSEGYNSRFFVPVKNSKFLDFGNTNKVVCEAEVFRFISVSI